MNEVLVEVEGVSKKFCRSLKRSLWYGLCDMGLELSGRSSGSDVLREDEFWAVKDVSFSLKRGDSLGLIGRNGAGKTTLLRMLSGLIKPNQGCIKIRGKVGALIALGAGFNPILTGRENIYINGSVLGLRKKEVDAKFDEIVDFSELSEFIDTPVKNYSAGMQVRLGFSIATRIQPDVLIIDEVLAVGDMGFRLKCYNEISRLSKNSAIIFVSHSLSQVAKVCNVGGLMKQGCMEHPLEEIDKSIGRYNSDFSPGGVNIIAEQGARVRKVWARSGADALEYTVDEISTCKGRQGGLRVDYSALLSLQFDVELAPDVTRFHVLITIEDMEQKQVAQISSYNAVGCLSKKESSAVQTVSLEIPEVFLNRGQYGFICTVREASEGDPMGKILCQYTNLLNVTIEGSGLCGGAPIQMQANWNIAEPGDMGVMK